MTPKILHMNPYHLSSNPNCFSVSSTIDFQSSSGVSVAQATVDAKKDMNKHKERSLTFVRKV